MKALTLRLDDGVHEALRQEAFDARVSISDIVRSAIGAYFGKGAGAIAPGHWDNGDPTHIITNGVTRWIAPNLNGATWHDDCDVEVVEVVEVEGA